jgi:hypothetical protein
MPLIYDQEIPLPKQRIALYGDPKVGKTPLALQLPFGSPYWGEAVYWAADDGSESLRSCPPASRRFLHVVKPARDPKGGKYDPIKEAWDILMTDWRKEWPGVKTFIWDTATETGLEALADIADRGQFSEKKHIQIGTPGSGYEHNLPMQGDYLGAQGEIARMLKAAFKLDMHLIVIFHTAIDETDNGTVIAGGPATVGKATIRQIAKPFDAVLRVEKKQVFDPATKAATQGIVIHSEAAGIWIGGVRTPTENPIPQVNVPMNKPLGAYWPLYMGSFYKEVPVSELAVGAPVEAATT